MENIKIIRLLSGEQVKTYALKDIIDYKEIYMLDGSKRIAQMYDLEADSIINILKGNLEESDLFEDNIYCIERLEYELENIMPELKKKYGLSICAIIKNEGNYILEWLEFHRLVGVEHFYIYDNDSTDGLYELIKDYIEKDIVTYINWPGVKQQLPAYNDAIERYKYESKYIAFIDADEFLFPVEGELLLPVIEDIFLKFIRCAGGIGVNWRTYGTSFHEDRQEGLLFENYKYRADDFDDINIHIKTICNPRKVDNFIWNPHAVKYKEKYCCISEHGSYISNAFFYDGMCRKLRINHYRTKSLNEYKDRLSKGKADKGMLTEETTIKKLEEIEAHNVVYDTIMDKYISKLKECLMKR